MGNQTNKNQFREDEIVIMSHWEKRKDEWVKSVYPKIGGRLRLAHDENDQLAITTEVSRLTQD